VKSQTVTILNIWKDLTKVFEFSVTRLRDPKNVIFRTVIYMTTWLCYWVILLTVSKCSGILWLKCVPFFRSLADDEDCTVEDPQKKTEQHALQLLSRARKIKQFLVLPWSGCRMSCSSSIL